MWDGISIIDDMTEEMWMGVYGMFNSMIISGGQKSNLDLILI